MTFLLKRRAPRRQILRGMLNGAAVGVALPFLDCFLNDHGTALASGQPLPVRFGTWFWGLGFSPGFGFSHTAADVQPLLEARALAPLVKDMNYFSGFTVALDGNPNMVHFSGVIVARTGASPTTQQDVPAPTVDVLIGDQIGGGVRFHSLDAAASGGPRGGYSARSTASRNAAETSPLALYARVFGPGFADPNNADFQPDPQIMVRRSVLTGVNDVSKGFMKSLGAADRARMDQYFTSIRELEQQLDLMMQRPAPNKACRVSPPPKDRGSQSAEGETEIASVLTTHKAMAGLMAMAVACNQTNVFTMTFSAAQSGLRLEGFASSHHTLSHEEPVDAKLGYQAQVSWFNQKTMEGCRDFIEAFRGIREGDGSLLDNTLIMAHSDTNDAKVHALDGIPVMTFGKAGGRFKTGLHVAGNGDSITRVGLTAMRAMGVPLNSWGVKSNETSKVVKEVLV